MAELTEALGIPALVVQRWWPGCRPEAGMRPAGFPSRKSSRSPRALPTSFLPNASWVTRPWPRLPREGWSCAGMRASVTWRRHLSCGAAPPPSSGKPSAGRGCGTGRRRADDRPDARRGQSPSRRGRPRGDGLLSRAASGGRGVWLSAGGAASERRERRGSNLFDGCEERTPGSSTCDQLAIPGRG